jgi:hypothetical protein
MIKPIRGYLRIGQNLVPEAADMNMGLLTLRS